MDSRIPRSLVLALVLAIASAGCASAPHEARDPDPKPAVAPAEVRAWSRRVPPQDLQPWSPRSSNVYALFVRRVLLSQSAWSAATLVCRPSFADEFAVCLVPPPPQDASRWMNSDSDEPWELVVTSARIWNGHDGGGPDWRHFDPDEFTVKRRSAPLDATVAREIAQAARTATRRARHPAPKYTRSSGKRVEVGAPLTTDGTSYEFESGDYFGTSHSPREGPAADLASLFAQLVLAVDALAGEARDDVLRDCALRARELNERLALLPW